MNWNTLFGPVVVALVPIVVEGIKKTVPAARGWVLPLIATVLGVALDTLSRYTTGTSVGPVAGAALGLAGVGLREVVDQLRSIGSTPK